MICWRCFCVYINLSFLYAKCQLFNTLQDTFCHPEDYIIMKKSNYLSVLTLLVCLSLTAQERPNIVLIFPDNLGMGEVGVYGGVRGVPTPYIYRIGNKVNNPNLMVGTLHTNPLGS